MDAALPSPDGGARMLLEGSCEGQVPDGEAPQIERTAARVLYEGDVTAMRAAHDAAEPNDDWLVLLSGRRVGRLGTLELLRSGAPGAALATVVALDSPGADRINSACRLGNAVAANFIGPEGPELWVFNASSGDVIARGPNMLAGISCRGDVLIYGSDQGLERLQLRGGALEALPFIPIRSRFAGSQPSHFFSPQFTSAGLRVANTTIAGFETDVYEVREDDSVVQIERWTDSSSFIWAGDDLVRILSRDTRAGATLCVGNRPVGSLPRSAGFW
ncbi:MAG: hypothetical protein AAF411_03280, partial [Myxococcota bacterium]